MPKNLLGASESLQGGGKGDFPILAGGSSEGRDGVRFTPLLEHKEEEELRKHMLIRNERRDSFTNASFTNADINDCIDWQFMRTALANERTFLAWVRTSLTLFSFGYGILKVESYLHKDELPWYDHVVAYVFTFAAICAFGIGCLRFREVKSILRVADHLEPKSISMKSFMILLTSVLFSGLLREIINDIV
mmetsp:Transcript_6603/g.10899  ORF Transcript_6603/g.10899 Transcript_6603/m.10899 type:complete len:191 (+) Transcript_6603:97-669(+)